MIESSKDILLLVIAFCVLWFTVFSCWVIYYVAMILREAFKTVKDVRKKLEIFDKILEALKEKLGKSSSYVKLAVESADVISGFIKAKKAEGKKSKKRKKSSRGGSAFGRKK